MKKSPDAFRTISEVAAWLETPAHVLRFWESRFPDLRPVQRAGGRRYYRPQDMLLLGGIKHLLHTEGHTIKSVQDRIKADGTDAVAAFSPPLGSPEDTSITSADAQSPQPPVHAPGDMHDGAAPTVAAQATHADRAHGAPPIGFFFDDSEDAAPAEAQSGTFAQTTVDDPASDGPLPGSPPDAVHDDPMPDPAPAAPRLGPLPSMPEDPDDDAAAYGTPLPLPARLRAIGHEDIADAHRATLTGLYRRLDGWQHAQR
jgi:DNA-binding transcriptional MerR regulator